MTSPLVWNPFTNNFDFSGGGGGGGGGTTYTGSGETVDDTTADLVTIPLGAVAGTFRLSAVVKGYESTLPAGTGYNVFATFITDGATAVLEGNQDLYDENDALEDADAYFIASGNNAILQVLGVDTYTIDWEVIANKI